jgi:hypothetical protein
MVPPKALHHTLQDGSVRHAFNIQRGLSRNKRSKQMSPCTGYQQAFAEARARCWYEQKVKDSFIHAQCCRTTAASVFFLSSCRYPLNPLLATIKAPSH